MTAPADEPSPPDPRAAAALCTLLSSPAELGDPAVREAAERARDLLRAGASDAELGAAYRALDTALRRTADARGLVYASRGTNAPGVLPHLRVAVCPGPAQCPRVERARDLWPAPQCAVNETRMRKGRLGVRT
ncbi:hypothetical protein ABZX40_22740 [Streptomyces sp. NPDC004610]|uniref:hypothetical protein n=1 Tax=unclassified Streptomyces TaxID=2593676 RepID=UPI0033A364BE